MLIREYSSLDNEDIFAINKICHAKPQPSLDLLVQIKKGKTWVAEVNGKVVGFLVSIYRQGPYIFNIAVLPGYRNQGIATKLFEQFEAGYKSASFYYLYVDVNNSAQKLYFDLGYRTKNIERDFYGPDESALVMVKVK